MSEFFLMLNTVLLFTYCNVVMNVPLRNHPRLPWIYSGSHNFTRSAWGMLLKSGSMKVLNYEGGVVLLPKNYVDYFNGDLKEKDFKDRNKNDDLCYPVDLVFGVPCLPYRSVDIPYLI